MIRLPGKNVMRLVIVLVVITIGVLGYVGYKDKKAQELKKEALTKDLLTKQGNLESIVQGSSDNLSGLSKIGSVKNLDNIKINLSPATSTQAVRQYGLDLKNALINFSQKQASEIQAVTTAIDQKNAEELKVVVASRLRYEETSQKLKTVLVPQNLANPHRQLINNIDNSIILLKQMEKALTQPEASLEASRLFLQESVYFYQIIGKINNYFKVLNINYSDQEKMQLFVNY